MKTGSKKPLCQCLSAQMVWKLLASDTVGRPSALRGALHARWTNFLSLVSIPRLQNYCRTLTKVFIEAWWVIKWESWASCITWVCKVVATTNWEAFPTCQYNRPLHNWNHGPLPVGILEACVEAKSWHREDGVSCLSPRGREAQLVAMICCNKGQSCPRKWGNLAGSLSNPTHEHPIPYFSSFYTLLHTRGCTLSSTLWCSRA